MSFICDNCYTITKPFEKMTRKVISQRDRVYWNVAVINPTTKRKNYFQYKERNVDILLNFKNDGFIIGREKITYGREIKKEISICKNCSDKMEAVNA